MNTNALTQTTPILTVFENSTIGVIPLKWQPHVHYNPKHTNSIVRIAIARNNVRDGPREAEGLVPSLVAFNDQEEYIGASNWLSKDRILSDTYVDVVVHQDEGIGAQGQDPAYLQVLGHDDAVCVAMIGAMNPRGVIRGWLGDMGRACGKRWFYSNLEVGTQGYSYRPDCTWLNRDHARDETDLEENIEAAAVQIHMLDFANPTDPLPTNISQLCHPPSQLFARWYPYAWTLSPPHDGLHVPSGSRVNFWTESSTTFKRHLLSAEQEQQPQPRKRFPSSSSSSSRSPTPRRPRQPQPQPQQRKKKTLVSSPHADHSARALCASETSHGPDFVSRHEGLFCDMDGKKVWPLCGGNMSMSTMNTTTGTNTGMNMNMNTTVGKDDDNNNKNGNGTVIEGEMTGQEELGEEKKKEGCFDWENRRLVLFDDDDDKEEGRRVKERDTDTDTDRKNTRQKGKGKGKEVEVEGYMFVEEW